MSLSLFRNDSWSSVLRQTALLVGLIASTTLAIVPTASASDGIREISQTCAVATGCFTGDTPGFPVTITGAAGRSYRLTSDLQIAATTTTGIEISASDVELDLAGFSIRGPFVCSGNPAVCTPSSGSGAGIASSAPFEGVRVHDGSVVGMHTGISLGSGATLSEVRVRSNRLDGAKALGDARFDHVVAYQNGGTGLSIGGGSVVDCIAHGNGGGGIDLGSASAIAKGNAVRANGSTGIGGSGPALVSGNVATANGDGIVVGAGSEIVGNVASSNGRHGIGVDGESSVRSNTVRANTGFGLKADGTRNSYRGNTFSANVGGSVSASSPIADQGANACDGVASCP